MTIKEKISIATQARSLKWTKSDEQHDERAIDRVAALGFAQIRSKSNSMGALLWRIKFGGDTSFHTKENAYWRLVSFSHGKGNMRAVSETLKAICRVAMDEWMDAPCPTCKGRKFVGSVFDNDAEIKSGKMKACPACSGIGSLIKTPAQRAHAVTTILEKREREASVRCKPNRAPMSVPNMGPIWTKVWDTKYDRVLDHLKECESKLGGAVKIRLGETQENNT